MCAKQTDNVTNSKSCSFSCDNALLSKFLELVDELDTNKSRRIQYLIKRDLIEQKKILPNKNEEICYHCKSLITKGR